MAKEEYKTSYRHAKGPVVISQGIGNDGPWYAMIRKANGCLMRFIPITKSSSPSDVLAKLEQYTGKAIRKETK